MAEQNKRIRKEQPRKIVDKLKGSSQYDLQELSKKSKSWFESEAKRLVNAVRVKGRASAYPTIGEMYIFHYNAKHKATLPFWDKLPLVFPFTLLDDGFIGLNFHYLHYKDRILLLSALEEIAYSKRTDVSTKLKLSYSILHSIAKNKKYEKCVHRYLFSHLKSPLQRIHSDNWIASLLLPNEMWTSSSITVTNNFVWSMK